MFRLKAGIVGLAGLLVILVSSSIYGEVIYSNNFEKETGWFFMEWGGVKPTVNYDGLSEEKALSGKKSYKLDLTLNGNNYCYYHHPIKPKPLIKSPLYFSGYIYVEKDSGCSVFLNILYTNPEGVKNCAFTSVKFVKREDGWRSFQKQVKSVSSNTRIESFNLILKKENRINSMES